MSAHGRLKLVPKKLGDHFHVSVFAGPAPSTLVNVGTLVLRQAEWDDLKERLDAGSYLLRAGLEIEAGS